MELHNPSAPEAHGVVLGQVLRDNTTLDGQDRLGCDFRPGWQTELKGIHATNRAG